MKRLGVFLLPRPLDAGSEINSLTWSPCGDLTKIFGRQVLTSGRQFFFPFLLTIKKAKIHVLDISTKKIAPGIKGGIFPNSMV